MTENRIVAATEMLRDLDFEHSGQLAAAIEQAWTEAQARIAALEAALRKIALQALDGEDQDDSAASVSDVARLAAAALAGAPAPEPVKLADGGRPPPQRVA